MTKETAVFNDPVTDEAMAFGQRDLSGTDHVYQWVNGVHLKSGPRFEIR
jgi:hypothetical protein